MNNERLAAIEVLAVILDGKSNLKHALDAVTLEEGQRSLLKALCYGVCRYYYQLDLLLTRLVDKKPKKKKLHLSLLLGIYQLKYLSIPDYAAVKQTVELLNPLKLAWAKGLVNGVLRNYCRNRLALEKSLSGNLVYEYAHPSWMIERFQADWPMHWQSILKANNEHPPMVLRVNTRLIAPGDYLKALQTHGIKVKSKDEACIELEQPVPVDKLPGFEQGLVSVQDRAAQLAAQLLDVQPGFKVLDACAAPGGKTAHLLESEASLELTAVDIESSRLEKIAQTLARLKCQAKLICADASDVSNWWDGQLFDRILLDAPCSAMGVIRRQPDIKLLRTVDEIAAVTSLQAKLLHCLWPLLKPGGLMLYATCSILPEENERQIERFIGHHDDAKPVVIEAQWGHKLPYGRQLLPGQFDGFYYALLEKV